MSLKNKIYNITGGAGRAVLFLLAIPFVVKFMGVDRFGVWALISSVGNIVLILGVGVSTTVTHYVAEVICNPDPKKTKVAFNTNLPLLILFNAVLSLVVAFLFIFFSPSIAHVFFSRNLINIEVIEALRWIGLYASLALFQSFFIGIIQAYENFLLINYIKMINLAVLNTGLLVFSYLNASFVYITRFMFLTSILITLTYIVFVSKKINFFKLQPIFNLQKAKEMCVFSLNTWASYIGQVLFSQFDKIIIGRVCAPEILGAYAAIVSITAYISSIASVGLQPIIPKLTKFWASFHTDKSEFAQEYKSAMQFNAFLVFSVALLFCLFSAPILTTMGIDQTAFQSTLFSFKLAAIIYAMNALSVPGFYALIATKQTGPLFKWQTIGSIIALYFIYLLSQRYGLIGAMIGNTGLLVTLKFNFIATNITQTNTYSWLLIMSKQFLLFSISAALILISSSTLVSAVTTLFSLGLLSFWFLKSNQEAQRLINQWFRLKL